MRMAERRQVCRLPLSSRQPKVPREVECAAIFGRNLTHCRPPPRSHEVLNGLRDRAPERPVPGGMLGQRTSHIRPALAHLRHGRLASGRKAGLQPSGARRIDDTEPLPSRLGWSVKGLDRLIHMSHPQELAI